jgi:hypothetical protein
LLSSLEPAPDTSAPVLSSARLATWGVVVYSALGVLANAATPSAPERALWLPVALLMVVTSGWVAWKTR